MRLKLDTVVNVAVLVACAFVSVIAWQTSRALKASVPPPRPAPPAPVEAVIGTTTRLPEAARRLGSGSIALIEFSDFQCPFCGVYARDTFPRLKAEFIDTHSIQYAARHLPLPTHPYAPTAANAAQCAADQSKYWAMHELLFRSQHALTIPELKTYGTDIGLKSGPYFGCLDDNAGNRVRADMEEAQRLGIRSTPLFLIGRIRADGEMVDVVEKIRGAQTYETIAQELKRLLIPPKASD